MQSKANPLSRKSELVVRELNGELLIYDLKIDKAYCLNETAALIWNLCDGERSLAELSQAMTGKLKKTATQDLVLIALDRLRQNNLLEDNPAGWPPLTSLSRREAIRCAGLASVIALPLISSLVAPKVADAQSTTCPPFNSGPGGTGDSCGCPQGVPAGTTCGTGGFLGSCQAGCVCTSTGVEPVGGNNTIGICG